MPALFQDLPEPTPPPVQAIDRELFALLQRYRELEEGEMLKQVRALLEQGANPNASMWTPHDFHCMLNGGCDTGFPTVVSLLLEWGASVVWPGEEPTHRQLVGAVKGEGDEGEFTAYCGLPLDPLCRLAGLLGENLGEYAILHEEDGYFEQMTGRWKIAQLLIEKGRGTDLIERGDPGIGRQAIDHLFLSVWEVHGKDLLSEQVQEVLGDLLLRAVKTTADAEHCLSAIAQGDFTDLPTCRWEWHQDQPMLAQRIRAQVTQTVLDKSVEAGQSGTRLRM